MHTKEDLLVSCPISLNDRTLYASPVGRTARTDSRQKHIIKVANFLILIYAFACPCTYGLISVSKNPISITDLLLVPSALIAILLCLRKTLPHPFGLPLLLSLIAIISTIQRMGQADFSADLIRAFRLLGMVLPVVLVGLLPQSAGRTRWFLIAYYVGALASVLVGLIGFYSGWEFTAAHETFLFGGSYRPRAGGLFKDSSAYGHLLATWFGCSMILTRQLRFRNSLLRLGWILINSFIFFQGLSVSISRSAAMDILFLFLAFILLPARPSPSTHVIRLGLVMLALLFYSVLGTGLKRLPFDTRDSPVAQRVDQLLRTASGDENLDDASSGRITGWTNNLNAWATSPIIGIGYKASVAVSGSPADNSFLLSLVETGLIGLSVYISMLVSFSRGFWLYYTKMLPAGRILLAFWAGQVVHSITVDTLTFPGSATFVLILSALIIKDVKQFFRLRSFWIPSRMLKK